MKNNYLFGIKNSGTEIIWQSFTFNERMKNYLRVNPTAYLVKKVKGEWKAVKMDV